MPLLDVRLYQVPPVVSIQVSANMKIYGSQGPSEYLQFYSNKFVSYRRYFQKYVYSMTLPPVGRNANCVGVSRRSYAVKLNELTVQSMDGCTILPKLRKFMLGWIMKGLNIFYEDGSMIESSMW